MCKFNKGLVLFIFINIIYSTVYGQYPTKEKILRFTSSFTSFPDTARQNGYTYKGVLYSKAEHYNDSSVQILVPGNFQASRKVELIFWFHGWNNNIDTALEFYKLKRQFITAGRNAIFVLAETAKNAPDSYGGKLENSGTFKKLVEDVLKVLKKSRIVTFQTDYGNILLAGHSGAYRAIAFILKNGKVPIQEVFLFDALYSQLDIFTDWLKENACHHFVNFFTNNGGGTDEMSDSMMQVLKRTNIGFQYIEESFLKPEAIKESNIIFIHSPREHNFIINNPDNFQLLLQYKFKSNCSPG